MLSHLKSPLLWSCPYPPASQDGYWSPVTSTINWCEEDYYATIYSAEIVNSVTNLPVIYLALRGAANCRANGHDTVFLVAFLGYGCMGMASFAFHSTLRYSMQLWDELAMIYLACLINWASFAWRHTFAYQMWLGILLTGIAVAITLFYHYLQDPVFHETAYALLTAIVLVRSIWLTEEAYRQSVFRSKRGNKEEHNTTGESAMPKAMRALIVFGLSLTLAAFGIWKLDNAYCSWLRAMRRQLGLPVGILLEGHGWWHLGAGYGAYLQIVWEICLRHCLSGHQHKYELRWPCTWKSIPEVVLKRQEVTESKKKR